MADDVGRQEWERKLREGRPGAIEAASEVANLMLATDPNGEPNWKVRKEAASALRGYAEDGTLVRLANDVIAEAEENGAA